MITVQIQISWHPQKLTDLDLHCLQREGISGFIRIQFLCVMCYVRNVVIFHTHPSFFVLSSIAHDKRGYPHSIFLISP